MTDDEFWYPTVQDILLIHENVISEDPDSEPGIRDEGRIEFVINYIKNGHFGEVPSSIHEKAFHLLRLLAANHYFVDGNKRTALNTTEIFCEFNNYSFATGEDIRSLLKLLAVEERLIKTSRAIKYFERKASSGNSTIFDRVDLYLFGQ